MAVFVEFGLWVRRSLQWQTQHPYQATVTNASKTPRSKQREMGGRRKERCMAKVNFGERERKRSVVPSHATAQRSVAPLAHDPCSPVFASDMPQCPKSLRVNKIYLSFSRLEQGEKRLGTCMFLFLTRKFSCFSRHNHPLLHSRIRRIEIPATPQRFITGTFQGSLAHKSLLRPLSFVDTEPAPSFVSSHPS